MKEALNDVASLRATVPQAAQDPGCAERVLQNARAIIGKLRAVTAAERQKYAARGGHIIWRILMPRTRNHIYFGVNDAAVEVEVLLVWNAIGERTPDV